MNESAVAFILWQKKALNGQIFCHRMDVGAVLFILWKGMANGDKVVKVMVVFVLILIVLGEIVQKGG